MGPYSPYPGYNPQLWASHHEGLCLRSSWSSWCHNWLHVHPGQGGADGHRARDRGAGLVAEDQVQQGKVSGACAGVDQDSRGCGQDIMLDAVLKYVEAVLAGREE